MKPVLLCFNCLKRGSHVQPIENIFIMFILRIQNIEKTKINTQHAISLFYTDLQVQIQISQCPGVPSDRQLSCVHAVAVRAGQDVFVVDLRRFLTAFTLCNDGVLNRKIERYGSYGYKV